MFAPPADENVQNNLNDIFAETDLLLIFDEITGNEIFTAYITVYQYVFAREGAI